MCISFLTFIIVFALHINIPLFSAAENNCRRLSVVFFILLSVKYKILDILMRLRYLNEKNTIITFLNKRDQNKLN